MSKHVPLYQEIRCNGWDGKGGLVEQYESLLKTKNNWVFRGQSDAEWHLAPSFQRLREKLESNNIFPKDLLETEIGLLRRFKREFSNYSSRAPDQRDNIEWLSWMRHFGGPTRLLDWTYSFYVAVFFALEIIESNKPSALWAINATWLENTLRSQYPQYDNILEKTDKNVRSEETLKLIIGRPLVIRLNPYYVHERLSVQQGCFLLPGDIQQTFEDNLLAFSGGSANLQRNLYKFIIPNDDSLRRVILEDLFRMNITRTSLFPGIGGFASSLQVLPFILRKNLIIPGAEDRYLLAQDKINRQK